MDFSILESLGKIAGLAGIAFGVVLLLFRQIIAKNVFAGMNRQQSYKLLRLIIAAVWSLAILGIVVWVYPSLRSAPPPVPEERERTVELNPTGETELGPFKQDQFRSLTIVGRWSPGAEQPFFGPQGSNQETLGGLAKWSAIIKYVSQDGRVLTQQQYPGHPITPMTDMKLIILMNDEPYWRWDNVNDPSDPMRVILRK